MPEPATPAGRQRAGTLLVLVVIVALVLGGAWALTSGQRAAAGPSNPVQVAGAATPPRVGAAVPDFTATTLAGTPVTLSQLRGKPVWLTFGATWCAPCRAEAPDLQAAYAAHQGRVSVVSVYLSEQPADVQRYTDLLGLTYTHVPDPEAKVSAAFGVNGIPVHLFIDADGVLRERREGALSRAAMDAALAAIGG